MIKILHLRYSLILHFSKKINALLKMTLYGFLVLLCSCSKKNNSTPAPASSKWLLVGGDEFNDAEINADIWLKYGTTGSGTSTYGRPQGMIQTYRPEQVQMVTLTTGEKVVRISSVKRTDGDVVHNQPGWWSGAISTREKGVFYPLYCRIDVRAKVANEMGIWHAIWSRYRDGASVAELDLNEIFVAKNGKNIVSQAIHLWNFVSSVTDKNLPAGQNRNFAVTDPANVFHTYSVQIDKDITATNEAVITMLIDDVVSYTLQTKNIPNHNQFIRDAINNNRLNNVWDLVVTGQVGASATGVGYPDATVNAAVTEVDWIRVYVRK